MAAGNFAQALALVLQHEGGVCDDPQDPGGRTNCGITHTDYDAYRRSKGLPTRDVYQMENSERDEIYRTRYWDAVCGDRLPAGLDYTVFDGAVNSGVAQSVKWLQRAVGNLTVDGNIGETTLAAVAQYPNPGALVGTVCQARREFLRHLSTFATFGKGWLNRVNDVQKTAMAWAAGAALPPVAVASATSQPKAARSSAANAPSTATGDAATAASSIGLGTAIIARSGTVAVAPQTPPAAPVPQAAPVPAAPTPTAPVPAPAPTPAPPRTAPQAKPAAPPKAPPASGTTTAAPPHGPLITLSGNQLVWIIGILAALLVLGLFLSWSARRARTRRADALGDNPVPKTALKPPAATPLAQAASTLQNLPLKSLSSRALAWAWIALTVIVNVIAFAKLLQGFGLAHEDWHGPFYWLGTEFDSYAGQAFNATSTAASQQFGITLPSWLMPIFVLYVSMASAFVVASAGLMGRDSSAEALFATVVHAGWVFAIPVFVRDAIRYRVVTHFARQNTKLFFVYVLSFIGLYVCARYVNDDWLPRLDPRRPGPAATVISEIYKDGVTTISDRGR